MTTKEKAKAYDEALERARKQRDDYQKELNKADKSPQLAGILRAGISAIELAFPELAESEDERIRKSIIHILQVGGYMSSEEKDKAFAYLEKQKINTEGDFARGYDCGYEACLNSHGAEWFEKQKEQNPTLKFKVGDKIHLIDGTSPNYEDDCITIREIGTLNYIGEFKEGYVPIKEQDKWELVKEQKPVEYLDKNKVYAIMNKLTELSTSDLIPIESEEYVKIHEITSDVCSLLNYPIEQKPVEWSKEDEKMRNLAIEWAETMSGQFSFVDMNPTDFRKITTWLKSLSLKKRNEDVAKPYSNEWSEEDKKVLDDAYCWLCEYAGSLIQKNHEKSSMLYEVANKLKSLSPQSKKEWSEEDKLHLNNAILAAEKEWGNDSCTSRWLKFLPERFGLYPKQEWSEEDWKLLDEVREHIIGVTGDKPDLTPNKIYDGFLDLIDKLKFAKPQLKQEWSKEDKDVIDEAAELALGWGCPNLSAKLKSILSRVKPAEWSEEDEKMLQSIIKDFRAGKVSTIGQEQWLKFLSPQTKEELAKMLQDEYNKGKETGEREGYIKGYDKGFKDANASLSYHPPVMPTTPSGWGCDGTHCTNPQMDCINCPKKLTGGMFNTASSSGNPTLKAEWKSNDGLDTDTLRDWSMRFAPDIREEIEATAYHFYNLHSSWKPREEQLDTLKFVIGNHIFGHQEHQGILESLYNDLKKLTKE